MTFLSLSVEERCIRRCMFCDSETWPVKKGNNMALHLAVMRLIRMVCGVKLEDNLCWSPCLELMETRNRGGYNHSAAR